VRIAADVDYTCLVQDLWSTFARTGDPNPNLADLAARGPAYESTLKLLQEKNWVWPRYDNESMLIASLQFPQLRVVEGLPDKSNGRCAVITAGSET
jgi:hypothetical protein